MNDASGVSIVIPAYNAAAFVEDAINSVLVQTTPAREIIVVNDGSKDDTLAILQALADRHTRATGNIPSLVIIDQKNAGVSAARNAAAAIATGHYIAFLDADDIYLPDFLTEALRAFQAFPDAVAFFCNQKAFNAQGLLPGAWFDDKPFIKMPVTEQGAFRRIDQSLFTPLLSGNFVPPSGTVLVKDAAVRAGLFQVGLATSEDRDFFCRVALHGSYIYTTDILSHIRIHESNASIATDQFRLADNAVRVLDKLKRADFRALMSPEQQQAVDTAYDKARLDRRYFASTKGLSAYLTHIRAPHAGFSVADILSKDFLRAVLKRS